jgi:hypothetical protein
MVCIQSQMEQDPREYPFGGEIACWANLLVMVEY